MDFIIIIIIIIITTTTTTIICEINIHTQRHQQQVRQCTCKH